MKTSPAALRSKIEQAKSNLARSEGERGTLQTEIDTNLTGLQKLLGCKPGEEKQAIQNLRAKIAQDEAEFSRLLDEAERARQAKPAEVTNG